MKKILSFVILFLAFASATAKAFDPATFPYIYPSSPWLNQNIWLQSTDTVSAGSAFGFNGLYAPTLNGNITNAFLYGANGAGTPDKVADINHGALYAVGTGHPSIFWISRNLENDSGASLDWNSDLLRGGGGMATLDWTNQLFYGPWTFDTIPQVTGSNVLINVTSNNLNGAINAGQIFGTVQAATNGPDGSSVLTSNNLGFTVSPANVTAPLQGKFSGLSYDWVNSILINTNQFIYAADVAGCYRPADKSWNIWFVALTNQTYTANPAAIYYSRSTNALAANPVWSIPVSVIRTNPTPNLWNSGTVNSERVYYDPTNDILYMTISGTTNANAFVFGGAGVAGAVGQVGIVTNAPGSNWSNSTSYVYINSGNPVLTYDSTVTYETNGGVFCANLIPTPLGGPITNWAMHYMCNSNFGTGQCFVANSTNLINWTKATSPALTGIEELNFIPTADNAFMASAFGFGGNQQTLNSVTYFSLWRSVDQNGASGWYNYGYIPFTLNTNIYTVFANRSVSPAYGTYIKNPDGTLLFVYSSLNNSTLSFISSAKVKLEPSHDRIDSDTLDTGLMYIGRTNNTFAASTYMRYTRTGSAFNWGSGIFMDPVGGNSFLSINQLQGDLGLWNTNFAATLGGMLWVGDRSSAHEFVQFGQPQFGQNFMSQVGIGSHADGNLYLEGGNLVNIRANASFIDSSNATVRGQSELVVGILGITNFVPIYGNGIGLTNLSTISMPYRSGLTNMPNLATSAAIIFSVPLNPNVGTNYSVTFGEEGTFSATSFSYPSAKTTNGFTLNLTTGITGGGVVTWTATPATQTNAVSVGY